MNYDFFNNLFLYILLREYDNLWFYDIVWRYVFWAYFIYYFNFLIFSYGESLVFVYEELLIVNFRNCVDSRFYNGITYVVKQNYLTSVISEKINLLTKYNLIDN
jgi:hypothetical protein